MEAVCADFGVIIAAAALQFVVAHPAIPSFCAGTPNVQQSQPDLA